MGHKRRVLAIGARIACGVGLSLVAATVVGTQRMRTRYEGEKADLYWGEVISSPEMVTDRHVRWEPVEEWEVSAREWG